LARGNPSAKIVISVGPELHAQVLAAAVAEGVSVSAWFTDAARRMLSLSDGLAAVAEGEAENGALTAEELNEARKRPGRTSRRAGPHDEPARLGRWRF
jgi:hypothetical protein